MWEGRGAAVGGWDGEGDIAICEGREGSRIPWGRACGGT